MTQLRLFSEGRLAVAHAPDPQPAKQAATRMNVSGLAATHAARVLSCVRAHPGSTRPEIALLLGMDGVECQRRLSDLAGTRGEFAIEKGPPRACAVKGTRLTTWRPRA